VGGELGGLVPIGPCPTCQLEAGPPSSPRLPNVDPAGLALRDLTGDERAALVAYAEGEDDA
jgi:hypothetical protein